MYQHKQHAPSAIESVGTLMHTAEDIMINNNHLPVSN
jgi:hypothetical protein